MTEKMKKQIELLKKYGVKNYTVENGKITINGSIYLRGLQSADKNILNKNVNQLKSGYNKIKKYCFFDGILSKVFSVKETKRYKKQKRIYNLK